MNCSSFEDLLEQYFENTLLPREANFMRMHLDRCAACAQLFEQVRVVDALLLTPHKFEAAPNFTFAIMAEVRTAAVPVRRKSPLVAVTIAYLAAAWLAIGLAFVFANHVAVGTLGSSLDGIRHLAMVLDALVRGAVHTMGSLGNTTALAGGILAVDLAVAFGLVYAVRRVRVSGKREARS